MVFPLEYVLNGYDILKCIKKCLFESFKIEFGLDGSALSGIKLIGKVL